MSFLLVAVVTSALLGPAPAVASVAPTQDAVQRVEYWLYPPGIAPGGRQRWGVIAAPTLEEARTHLESRQASQQRWRTWVGARNDSNDDPFGYANYMGPVEVKRGAARIPNGITTNNVWIVSLEEVAVRRRAARELADLRVKLERAKEELDTLLPIGKDSRSAADLRGRAIYMAAPLASTMAQVREAEAVLQAAHGYTLADLMFEIDQVNTQLRVLLPTVQPAPVAVPTTATMTSTTTAPKSIVPDSSGATVLAPPSDQQPAGQSPTVLVPGGATAGSSPSTRNVAGGPTSRVIYELNRRFGSPFPGRTGDDTLFAYQFDREGFTSRTQTFNGARFLPAPPERIAFAAIGDPEQLFLYKAERMSVAYGDSDTSKFQFRPIVMLPTGTTEAQANEALELMRHLVAPDRVPANFSATASAPVVSNVPSEAEANARMDEALSTLQAPNPVTAQELVPSVLPDWLREHLIARSTYDSGTLAGYYSEHLAQGALVLDQEGRSASLERIAGIICGDEHRAGEIDRALWTVTAYEERNGSIELTLQASYVGASAASMQDRSVHGVKLKESWTSAPTGVSLNRIVVLRPGTIYRPVPPTPDQFAERHFEEANRLFRDGRPNAALAEYEATLRLHPENPEYWSQYAIAQYQLGQNPDALASYRLARDLAPQNGTIIANYSAVLRSIGDFSTAIAAGKQGTEVDPTGVWPREAYALALFEAQDFAAAAEQYAEAVKLAPKDARIRANYASALLRNKQRDLALAEAKAAYDAGFRSHWVFQELKIGG
jgi:tetratricopeptide (TPR) repeat protein